MTLDLWSLRSSPDPSQNVYEELTPWRSPGDAERREKLCLDTNTHHSNIHIESTGLEVRARAKKIPSRGADLAHVGHLHRRTVHRLPLCSWTHGLQPQHGAFPPRPGFSSSKEGWVLVRPCFPVFLFLKQDRCRICHMNINSTMEDVPYTII